jgi:integrase
MVAVRVEARAPQGPAILRPREVRELLRLPDLRTRLGRRDAALLAVLALGGLRVGEACRTTIDALEGLQGGRLRITVRTSKGRAGSPPRYRTVTLAPVAATLVRTYLDRRTPMFWMFPGRRNEHLSTSAARRAVTRYLRELNRADLHTHSLRHSFGSMVVRATSNIWVAQKLLGHSSPAVTSRYYAAFDTSDSDAASDALAAAVNPRKFGTAGR